MISSIYKASQYEILSINLNEFAEKIAFDFIQNKHRMLEKKSLAFFINNYFKEDELIYNSEGKPLLKNSSKKISISHSTRRLVIQLSENLVPGIDTEILRNQLIKIKSKFVSNEEHNLYTSDNNLLNLCLIWSAKEAIFKSAGIVGLSFLEQIKIKQIIFENKEKGSISAALYTIDAEIDYLLKFFLPNDDEVIVFVDELFDQSNSTINSSRR